MHTTTNTAHGLLTKICHLGFIPSRYSHVVELPPDGSNSGTNFQLTIGDHRVVIAEEPDEIQTWRHWGWVFSFYIYDNLHDTWDLMTADAEPIHRLDKVSQRLVEWAHKAVLDLNEAV